MDDDSQKLIKRLNILTASNESETFDVKPKQSSPDVVVASEANGNELSGIQHLENEEDSNKNHDTSTLTTALPSNLNVATTINEEQQLTVPTTSNTASSSSSLSSCPITNLLSFIRFPMSKIFIISSIILLISFFGNIKLLNNTNWSSLSTNIPQLFERIENLELQNNLLRAEIDILSKNLNSINYNNRREKYQKDDKQKFNSNPNDEDKIKWKNDDKNYDNKVDDNDNKNNRKKEQIIIQKDENFIKKSNINEKTDIPLPPLSSATPKNDDKNSLNLENQNQSNNNGPVINDDNNSNERSKQNQNENESNLKSDGGKDFKKKYDNSKDNYKNKKYEKKKYDKYNKYKKKKFSHDDDDDDNDSKELTNSKEYYDKKKKYTKNEKHFKKYHDYDDEDDDDDNDSKESKNYKYDEKRDKSKKRYDSREREYYGKRKNGEKEKLSRDEGGGRGKYENYDDRYRDDWHEKMMQYREQARKSKYDNNKNNDKNHHHPPWLVVFCGSSPPLQSASSHSYLVPPLSMLLFQLFWCLVLFRQSIFSSGALFFCSLS